MELRDLDPDFAPFFPRPPFPLPDIVELVVVESVVVCLVEAVGGSGAFEASAHFGAK